MAFYFSAQSQDVGCHVASTEDWLKNSELVFQDHSRPWVSLGIESVLVQTQTRSMVMRLFFPTGHGNNRHFSLTPQTGNGNK